MNEPKLIDVKCSCCSKEFKASIADICANCFMNKMKGMFPFTQQKPSLWRELKRASYHVIFYATPLWFIAVKFGLKTELLAIGFAVWSEWCVPNIIRFMMKVF
jgi:hypothetical protein